MTTVYSRAQLSRVIRLDDVIDVVEQGFIALSGGQVIAPSVGHLDFKSPPGECHIKYGYILGDNTFTIKLATGFYDNPKKGLPSSNGVVLVMSSLTGELLTIFQDEGFLTEVRTAAGGAVAAKYLAPSHVPCIGIVGAGLQARLQLDALRSVTSCRKVLVWSRSAKRAKAFRVEGFEIAMAGSVRELVVESRLIVTTTPSRQWLISADDVREGTHITALGADGGGKQEIDPRLFKLAAVCAVDSRRQCLAFGDTSYAVKAGLLSADDVIELGEIIKTGMRGRRDDKQITIADLTGVVVQDIQIAKLAAKALQDHRES